VNKNEILEERLKMLEGEIEELRSEVTSLNALTNGMTDDQ
jgi:prefoldin subunit 5